MKTKCITAALALFSLAATAQYGYRDSNRIGIGVGINQMTLNTDNFETKPGTGWNAGLSVRGNFYNDFDMVYALQFSENSFSAASRNAIGRTEDVQYKLPSAQISLMLSYVVVENHFSIEFGPVFQFNDKLKLDKDDQKDNLLLGAELKDDGTALQADDILQISRFNFYPAAGITAGVRHFRVNVQYQYGLVNTLAKLNDAGNNIHGFKGNSGILTGTLLIYL